MAEFWPLGAYLGIMRHSSEEEIFRELMEVALTCLHADEGSLLLLDDQASELVFALTTGSTTSEDMLRGQRVPLGKGISGLAALTQTVQIGSPVYKDIKQSEIRAGAPNSVVAAPMLLHGKTVGVMTSVSFDSSRTFNMQDGKILQRVANISAIVIEQRRHLSRLSGDAAEGTFPAMLSNLDQAIVNSITALTRDDPQRAQTVASLLNAIQRLTS